MHSQISIKTIKQIQQNVKYISKQLDSDKQQGKKTFNKFSSMVGNLRKVLHKFEDSPLIVELLDELEILKKRITYQQNQANLVKKRRREREHAARERIVLENIKRDPKKLAHVFGESNLPIKTDAKRIWITTVSGGRFSPK